MDEVPYLPAGAAPREIRFVEVNRLIPETAKPGPVDFGLGVDHPRLFRPVGGEAVAKRRRLPFIVRSSWPGYDRRAPGRRSRRVARTSAQQNPAGRTVPGTARRSGDKTTCCRGRTARLVGRSPLDGELAMRQSFRWLLAAVVLALAAAPAWAQPPEGGRGGRGRGLMGMMRGGLMPASALLNQKPVQEELRLSDEQKKEVAAFGEKMREAWQDAMDAAPEERMRKMMEMRADGDKAVSRILRPEQAKRLHQIALQAAGARALADPKVASELSLDDSQKDKIREAGEEQMKKMEELRGESGGDRDKRREKMADLRRETDERIREVLTPGQRARWKDMLGEPFKGIEQLRMAGPGRRGRGPGGPPGEPPPDRP